MNPYKIQILMPSGEMITFECEAFVISTMREMADTSSKTILTRSAGNDIYQQALSLHLLKYLLNNIKGV